MRRHSTAGRRPGRAARRDLTTRRGEAGGVPGETRPGPDRHLVRHRPAGARRGAAQGAAHRLRSPPPRSDAGGQLAEARRLNDEVERLYGGRCREATAEARQALALFEQVRGEHQPGTGPSGPRLRGGSAGRATEPLFEQARCRRGLRRRQAPPRAGPGYLQAGPRRAPSPLRHQPEQPGGGAGTKGTMPGPSLSTSRPWPSARKCWTPTHTAQSLDDLGGCCRTRDYAAAKPLLEQALAIHEQVLRPAPPRHRPEPGRPRRRCSRCRRTTPPPSPSSSRPLAIQEVYGADHPATALSLNNLAMLLYAGGGATPPPGPSTSRPWPSTGRCWGAPPPPPTPEQPGGAA